MTDLFHQDDCIEKALIISTLANDGYGALAEIARKLFQVDTSVKECQDLKKALQQLLGEDSHPTSTLERTQYGTISVSVGPDGAPYIVFPDDLMQQLSWQEGDDILWIDNKDDTYTLKKRTCPTTDL